MTRATIDRAAKWAGEHAGGFDVRRFRRSGSTKAQREAEWLAYRTKGVGGSDMSTILGLNPYATPYDLWLEKTGRVPHEDISDKWAVVKGNALEKELRRRFRTLHPEWQVIDGTDISLASKTHPVMHASLDGFIWDEAHDSWGVLELKTANANRGRSDWHDDCGDLVAPDYYMAQVTHYMAVTGFTWGYFYADIGESEPVEIRFERDEDDVKAVVRAAEEFWGFVQRDEMPRLKGGDVAKAYPEPSEGVVDESRLMDVAALMAQYESALDDLKHAKESVDLLKDAIVVHIGDRQGVRCGEYEATYKAFHRDGYTRVVKPSDGRTFRFRKLKERN